MATRIVELVGAGGTGKTSIATKLGELYGFAAVTVYERNSSAAKARAILEAGRLTVVYRLDLAEAISLFRKCSSVENGLGYIRRSGKATLILDEGPIRTLRDTRCGSFRERAAWWRYSKRVLTRIAERDIPILVVHIRLNDAVRHDRYIDRVARTQEAQMRAAAPKRRIKVLLDRLSRRKNAQTIPTLGRAVSTMLGRCRRGCFTEIGLDVAENESPADIAHRLRAAAGLQDAPTWTFARTEN